MYLKKQIDSKSCKGVSLSTLPQQSGIETSWYENVGYYYV